MVFDIPARVIPFYLLELILLLGGVVVWWAFQIRASSARWRLDRLRQWGISGNCFTIICLLTILSSLAGAAAMRGVGALLPAQANSDPIFLVMLSNLGLHLGAVIGALVSTRRLSDSAFDTPPPPLPEHAASEPLSTGQAIVAGIVTFVAALVLLAVVAWLWDLLLKTAGIPAEKQELIDIFGKTKDPAKLGLMIFIAVVVAPLAEELAFRAGIFRFLRGRVSPFFAYTIPATLFASLHYNLAVFAPLLALGIIFSIAYKRTGRILTTVIAHGLFNLNTIIVVLSGADML